MFLFRKKDPLEKQIKELRKRLSELQNNLRNYNTESAKAEGENRPSRWSIEQEILKLSQELVDLERDRR